MLFKNNQKLWCKDKKYYSFWIHFSDLITAGFLGAGSPYSLQSFVASLLSSKRIFASIGLSLPRGPSFTSLVNAFSRYSVNLASSVCLATSRTFSEHQNKYNFGELKEAKMPGARLFGDQLVLDG